MNSDVKIVVYDITGRKIITLAHQTFSPGQYIVSWDGKDISGKSMSSGIYFVNIESSYGDDQKKIVLVR